MIGSGQRSNELVDLIGELRRNGYSIGTQQYIAAQRLLIALAALGDWPGESSRLGAMLAPVFCTSRHEQENFFRFYEQWRRLRPGLLTETKGTEEARQTSKPGDPTPEKTFEQSIPVPWIKGWIWPVALAAVVSIIVLLPLLNSRSSSNPILRGIVVSSDGSAIRGASIELLVGEGHVSRSHEITGVNGEFALAYLPGDFPGPILRVDASGYSRAETGVSQPGNITVVMNQGEKQVQLVTDPTPSRAGQFWEFYKNHNAWSVAIMAGVIVLCIGLGRRRSSRRMKVRKWRTKHKPRLDKLSVKGAAEDLTRLLRRTAQEMRRRRQDGTHDLDIQQTIDETLNKGIFTPAYRARQSVPEYLALIDRSSFSDQQARLADEIMARLAKNDVYIERYFFQGDPRICRKDEAGARFQTLQDLAALYPDHRLLILSDGAGLFNPLTGRPQDWIEMLEAWGTRVLLTAELQAGDYQESALVELGFGVLPAGKAGLAALGAGPSNGPRRRQGSQSMPLPAILQERSDRWLESHPPSPSVLNKLCRQLKGFLGEELYYWLSACAVYPMLQWDLTLYLGHTLINRDKFDEKLSMLVRLPWFRNGSMPDWLRERLILELPPEQEERIRSALEELLLTSLLHPDGFVLPLVLEPEDVDSNFLKTTLSRLKAKASDLKKTRFLRDLLTSEPEDSLLNDYVLLSFMSGRKPNRLALSIPEELQSLFYSKEQPIWDLYFVRAITSATVIFAGGMLVIFAMSGLFLLLGCGWVIVLWAAINVSALRQFTRSDALKQPAVSPVSNRRDAPVHEAPPSQEEPQVYGTARLGPWARLGGMWRSPRQTFADINRKPTWLAPMIIAVITAVAASLFFTWRVHPNWDEISRTQIKKRLEKSNLSLPEEQMQQQVNIAKTIAKLYPIIGAVSTPIGYFIVAGVFAFGMMLIKAKTTFKKTLSVVSWTFAAMSVLGTIVMMASLMAHDEEGLRNIDPTQPSGIVPTNLAVFLASDASPVIKVVAGSLDVFSIWNLILLSIGFAAIAGSRKITTGKTAILVFGFWAVYVLIKVVLGGILSS